MTTDTISQHSSMSEGRLAFFNLVRSMRQAQKEYFRTRAHSALMKSKELERRVDEYIARGDNYLSQQQPSLFDGANQ